ncbi:unnamed protein product, partial [Durusdinium trenchii]
MMEESFIDGNADEIGPTVDNVLSFLDGMTDVCVNFGDRCRLSTNFPGAGPAGLEWRVLEIGFEKLSPVVTAVISELVRSPNVRCVLLPNDLSRLLGIPGPTFRTESLKDQVLLLDHPSLLGVLHQTPTMELLGEQDHCRHAMVFEYYKLSMPMSKHASAAQMNSRERFNRSLALELQGKRQCSVREILDLASGLNVLKTDRVLHPANEVRGLVRKEDLQAAKQSFIGEAVQELCHPVASWDATEKLAPKAKEFAPVLEIERSNFNLADTVAVTKFSLHASVVFVAAALERKLVRLINKVDLRKLREGLGVPAGRRLGLIIRLRPTYDEAPKGMKLPLTLPIAMNGPHTSAPSGLTATALMQPWHGLCFASATLLRNDHPCSQRSRLASSRVTRIATAQSQRRHFRGQQRIGANCSGIPTLFDRLSGSELKSLLQATMTNTKTHPIIRLTAKLAVDNFDTSDPSLPRLIATAIARCFSSVKGQRRSCPDESVLEKLWDRTRIAAMTKPSFLGFGFLTAQGGELVFVETGSRKGVEGVPLKFPTQGWEMEVPERRDAPQEYYVNACGESIVFLTQRPRQGRQAPRELENSQRCPAVQELFDDDDDDDDDDLERELPQEQDDDGADDGEDDEEDSIERQQFEAEQDFYNAEFDQAIAEFVLANEKAEREMMSEHDRDVACHPRSHAATGLVPMCDTIETVINRVRVCDAVSTVAAEALHKWANQVLEESGLAGTLETPWERWTSLLASDFEEDQLGDNDNEGNNNSKCKFWGRDTLLAMIELFLALLRQGGDEPHKMIGKLFVHNKLEVDVTVFLLSCCKEFQLDLSDENRAALRQVEHAFGDAYLKKGAEVLVAVEPVDSGREPTFVVRSLSRNRLMKAMREALRPAGSRGRLLDRSLSKENPLPWTTADNSDDAAVSARTCTIKLPNLDQISPFFKLFIRSVGPPNLNVPLPSGSLLVEVDGEPREVFKVGDLPDARFTKDEQLCVLGFLSLAEDAVEVTSEGRSGPLADQVKLFSDLVTSVIKPASFEGDAEATYQSPLCRALLRVPGVLKTRKVLVSFPSFKREKRINLRSRTDIATLVGLAWDQTTASRTKNARQQLTRGQLNGAELVSLDVLSRQACLQVFRFNVSVEEPQVHQEGTHEGVLLGGGQQDQQHQTLRLHALFTAQDTQALLVRDGSMATLKSRAALNVKSKDNTGNVDTLAATSKASFFRDIFYNLECKYENTSSNHNVTGKSNKGVKAAVRTDHDPRVIPLCNVDVLSITLTGICGSKLQLRNKTSLSLLTIPGLGRSRRVGAPQRKLSRVRLQPTGDGLFLKITIDCITSSDRPETLTHGVCREALKESLEEDPRLE